MPAPRGSRGIDLVAVNAEAEFNKLDIEGGGFQTEPLSSEDPFACNPIRPFEQSWPKTVGLLRRKFPAEADSLLPTQPIHSDRYWRFSKAAVRQPSGNLAYGWLSAGPLLERLDAKAAVANHARWATGVVNI